MGPKSLAAWQSHYCMWNSVPGLPSSCLLYPAGAADLSSLLLIVKWGIFIKLIKIQIHLSHWPASHFLLVLFMEETRILRPRLPHLLPSLCPAVVATHLSFVSGTPTHPQGHWEGKPSLTSLKRPVPSYSLNCQVYFLTYSNLILIPLSSSFPTVMCPPFYLHFSLYLI